MEKSKSARAFGVYRRMAESDRKALKWSGNGIYSVSVGGDGSLARTRYCDDFEDLTLFFGGAVNRGIPAPRRSCSECGSHPRTSDWWQ